jgi:hypothetical protein
MSERLRRCEYLEMVDWLKVTRIDCFHSKFAGPDAA